MYSLYNIVYNIYNNVPAVNSSSIYNAFLGKKYSCFFHF
nr:MAG TPA: hypothetical protein [Caudoviricetes sp.]